MRTFLVALPIVASVLSVGLRREALAAEPPAESEPAVPAAEPKAAAPDATVPTRVFGVGVGIGGGVAAVTVSSTGSTVTGLGPLIYLPTIETQIFIPDTDGMSIDISLPVTNIAIASAVLSGFYWETDAFFNFGPGGQNVRLVAGPGIGFNAFSYSGYSSGGIRFLGEVGFEALTDGQGFSFKLLARPFFEVFMGDLGGASGVGGGVSGMLCFSGNYVE